MILRCPNCGARFRVPADALGAEGRQVRCSRCRHQWRATVNDLGPEPAPAAAPKTRRAAAAAAPPAKKKPTPKLRPAAPPPPPPPPAAAEPEPPPPPLPLPEPEPESVPPPTTEAAEDARLQAEAEPTPAMSAFEEALAKAVAPRPGKAAPAKSSLLKRLAVAAGWILLVIVVGGLAGVAYEREMVMNAYPQTKPVYAFLGFELPPPGEGLRLTNVNSTRTTTDGVPVLVIEGKVTNTSAGPRDVPAMRGSLRDSKDQELQSWMFKADSPKLAAGETASFKTEVQKPSPQATGLSISFTAEASK
jgi:predicted Zn finger-like uncharacterized protein